MVNVPQPLAVVVEHLLHELLVVGIPRDALVVQVAMGGRPDRLASGDQQA